MFKKKERSLKEVDELFLGKISNAEKEVENITKKKDVGNSCKFCGGKLKKVKPEVAMGDLILHECTNCGEREYI